MDNEPIQTGRISLAQETKNSDTLTNQLSTEYIDPELHELSSRFQGRILTMLYAQANDFPLILTSVLKNFAEEPQKLADFLGDHFPLYSAKFSQKIERKPDNFKNICWLNPDLEDAVPCHLKDQARETLAKDYSAVGRVLDEVRVECDIILGLRPNKPLLRGNGDANYGLNDLKKILSLERAADIIQLPKINNPAELDFITKLCEEFEHRKTPFFLIIESLESLNHIDDLLAHPRVFGAVMGVQDLLLDFLKKKYFVLRSNTIKVRQKSFDGVKDVVDEGLKLLETTEKRLREASRGLGKFNLAPSSFSNNFAMSHRDFFYYLRRLAMEGRTAVHPDQFPASFDEKIIFGGGNIPETKEELYFLELDEETLFDYLNQVLENSKANYFPMAEREGGERYPNYMGRPILKYITLLSALHLEEYKRINYGKTQLYQEKMVLLTQAFQKFFSKKIVYSH